MFNLKIIAILLIFISSKALAISIPNSKCLPTQHWVHAYHRRAYYRANGTYVSATDVSAHCADNPPSYAIWKPKLKPNLPKGWPIKETGKKWTEEEIERTTEALSELPDSLLVPSVTGIYRAAKSKDYPNPASSRKNEIVLYDTAFDEKRNLAQILAHEFGHQIYRNLSKEDLNNYLLATNWFPLRNPQKGNIIWGQRKERYVEPDGMTSPEEDFANNIEYFLFHPEILKKTTPSAYNWISQHFGPNFKIRGKK